jgi:crotonobetainyl-CoA:carnitine CoA-transferase CaiB-like acyl-CoA transferase
MRRALSGVTVVELAGGIAGAYCGKLFAGLGADVVRVERPADDAVHDALDRAQGLLLHLGTDKRRAAFDPARNADRATVRALVGRADLVIESRHQNDLASWGLDWDDLHERCPGLSVAHLSGFGATGPYADYAFDDIVAQAVAGSFLLLGHPRLDPVRLPGHVALHFVGHVAAVGALSAVLLAERGQGGSFVDCAAVDALATVPIRQAPLLGYQYRGCTEGPDELSASMQTLIPTGVFPCADGHVALMSTAQQLNEMLEVLGDPGAKEAFAHPDAFSRPETKEALDLALYPWLFSHTRAEATAEAQAAGWPCTGLNSAAEVLEADHLHQRGFWVHADHLNHGPNHGPLAVPGAWCRFGEGGWALQRLAADPGEDTAAVEAEVETTPATGDPPRPRVEGVTASAGRPLDGVRVVDLTVVWAGPYATMLLADLGAEVIRVENPFVLPPTTKGYHPRPVLTNPGFLGSLYGTPREGAPDRPWNRHAMNNTLARNKLSVTIDTRRDEGRELLMRLAERSDVFIDNFKASGLARMGIDVSELQRRNPRLVLVRLPPAGLTGDWADYVGFGAQFDGLTGFLSICGHRDGDPADTPVTTYMDQATGPAGAFATMAALRYRAGTGRGQFVELAQSENILNHLGDVLVDCQLGVVPERLGNRHAWRAPQGLYATREPGEWVAVSVGDDAMWRALAACIGQPELGDDARFTDAAGRRAHHDELDEVISAWTATRTASDAFHELQATGVAAGPLLDDARFTTDPHVVEREWFRPLYSDDVGTHLHPGLAFSGVPHAWRRGSPTLGEDNEYVYKEVLGVSDDDYRRHADEQILATDYLMPDGTPY